MDVASGRILQTTLDMSVDIQRIKSKHSEQYKCGVLPSLEQLAAIVGYFEF